MEWVTVDTIRQHFNDGQYWQKVSAGELIDVVMKSRVPAALPAGEPAGTLSQLLFYYTSRRALVAIVHQYLRPDGNLGGSGRPDPKWLRLKGRILKVKHKASK